ncbi:MAG TPA: urate hydroxylase PuuD [Verrucomicrobiae bacterium]|nr:urate hydroxylase PuuD [Verrucomicrobiae bacterium]
MSTGDVAKGDALLVLGRWLHIGAGVAWIGLLYYFNFVQVPALAEAAADKGGPGGAGVTKYVAPRALLWFRWAALVTWLSGALYLVIAPHLGFLNAFTLGLISGGSWQHATIGLGAWLGTIMLFNVWMIIWPNQQKVLGLKPATDAEKAVARRRAFLASRTNTMLSLPMLLCMAASSHGLPF